MTTGRKYTRCIFRALSHMLAVGYGQGPPTTTTETWIVMVSMMTGITLYAMFVAYMARLVASLDYSGHKYDAMASSHAYHLIHTSSHIPPHTNTPKHVYLFQYFLTNTSTHVPLHAYLIRILPHKYTSSHMPPHTCLFTCTSSCIPPTRACMLEYMCVFQI